MPSTYDKWVDELGVEGAKAKMAEIGSVGGKRGGGKAGWHTMPKSKHRELSSKGGRRSVRKKL